jgi:glycosyltransferase involved in cell wall biosynthesis
MKVLMLTEYLPSTEAAEITGGVETRCYYVSRHLAEHNDVEVVALRSEGGVWSDASLRSVGSRVRFLGRALARGMRADFDVVEATNQTTHAVAWFIARTRRRALIFWYPNVLLDKWRSDFGAAGWMGMAVERLNLLLKADRYIAITETVKHKLIRHGIPPDRIRVIPCGYEQELVNQVAGEPIDPRYTIAVVSRLVRYKRVHVVVDAVAKLVADGWDANMVVVGQGPEEEALRNQATRLGIGDRVEFRGFVRSHRDVLRTIRSAKVLVNASTVEGFGIVVAEAMALGRPYVVPNIEVFREVTGNGTGGVLFRPDDAADCASKIVSLLSDEERYAGAAAEGVMWAARYRWRDVAAQTEQVMREACADQKRSPRGEQRRPKGG